MSGKQVGLKLFTDHVWRIHYTKNFQFFQFFISHRTVWSLLQLARRWNKENLWDSGHTDLNLSGKLLLALFPIIALTLVVLGPSFKEPALQWPILGTHYSYVRWTFQLSILLLFQRLKVSDQLAKACNYTWQDTRTMHTSWIDPTA